MTNIRLTNNPVLDESVDVPDDDMEYAECADQLYYDDLESDHSDAFE